MPAELHQTTWCGEMAIRFITEQRDGPWLLSVNPFDPHAPFDAPPEYRARVRRRGTAAAAVSRLGPRAADARSRRSTSRPRSRPIRAFAGVVEPVSAGDHDAIASHPPHDYDALEVKANYYAMIMLLDDQCGASSRRCAPPEQLDDTIVVYMSDHGEMLGDHGLILKGCRFFDGLVRVPLIMSWPGRFAPWLVSDALVETGRRGADAARRCRAAGSGVDAGTLAAADALRAADPDVHKRARDLRVLRRHGRPRRITRTGRWSSTAAGSPSSTTDTRSANSSIIERDPGEFDNLWDDPAHRELRHDRVRYHLDAMMGTIGIGPPRLVNF